MEKQIIEQYKKWMDSEALDEAAKAELAGIEQDEKEIRERFAQMLKFGTAGLRGIMRMGLNGMNIYTVRLAAQAMANVIIEESGQEKGVTIAYDSRNNSELFAGESACVLAANGIRVNLFESLRPTPELSFALRQTGSIAGINITASHNTKEYNGFKAYWADGAQIAADLAGRIAGEMDKTDIFTGVKTMDRKQAVEKGLIRMLGQEMDEDYLAHVMEQSVGAPYVEQAADELKIIYTPFHGTGYKLVPEVLKRLGMKHVITVPEQMVIDGDFPTVKSPNPEYREGFAIAIDMAEKENVDLIIGTDPDGDRCGIVVRKGNEYRTLTGNQIGVLLLDYLIRARKEQGSLPENAIAVKSIVSTTMADRICAEQGISVANVLTGFKYIGEKIKEYEATGEHTFIFGFEESNGYLAGTYARDKDAVLASMLIAEMACYYHLQGKTLQDAMDGLYETYGQYREKVVSFVFEGLDGQAKMSEIMEKMRRQPPAEVGLGVERIRDYQSGEIVDCAGGAKEPTGLPKSNILFYELAESCTAIIRPSGTEPKIKFYIMARGAKAEEAEERLAKIEAAGSAMLKV
ncbi:MAG: phospho-sugar mutase [Firmicutes bacterium]|nr:phospho-sugar mutase [Bacillota bacterium]